MTSTLTLMSYLSACWWCKKALCISTDSLTNLHLAKPARVPKCGAPHVDWENAEDSKAPEGWTNLGLTNDAGNRKSCARGWNGYARLKEQGQLYATMKGSGRATVEYRDCLAQGFASLYLNGKLLDKTEENNGKLQTFRLTRLVNSIVVCFECCLRCIVVLFALRVVIFARFV